MGVIRGVATSRAHSMMLCFLVVMCSCLQKLSVSLEHKVKAGSTVIEDLIGM